MWNWLRSFPFLRFSPSSREEPQILLKMFHRRVQLDLLVLVTWRKARSRWWGNLLCSLARYQRFLGPETLWAPSASSSPAPPVVLCIDCQQLLIQEASSEVGAAIFPKCKLLHRELLKKLFCALKKKASPGPFSPGGTSTSPLTSSP